MAGGLWDELPSPTSDGRKSMIFITANTPANLLKLRFINVNDDQIGSNVQASKSHHSYRKVSDDDDKIAEEWLTLVNCHTTSTIRKANMRRSTRSQGKTSPRPIDRAAVYNFVKERHSGDFHEMIPVINTVQMFVSAGNLGEVDRWLEAEHIDLLSRTPGWQRSRTYHLATPSDPKEDDKTQELELLVVHEFTSSQSFDSVEFATAHSTTWSKNTRDLLAGVRSRIWDFEGTGPSL